jgi:hypothetical protein
MVQPKTIKMAFCHLHAKGILHANGCQEGFEVKKKKGEQPCLVGGGGLLKVFLVVQGRSCMVDRGGDVAEGG